MEVYMGERLFSGIKQYKMEIDYDNFQPKQEKIYFEKSGKKMTEISFSSENFFHDIVTCGMPQFYLNRRCYMKRSEEIKYKIYLMRAALEVDDDGYIIVSDNIKYLDSSEKNFIKYYIGMFMTKLVSREIFDYEYLVHLGIVSQYKKVCRDSKEPDLVGFKNKTDEYSLFEAKGRQAVHKKMVADAKAQLKSVHYISGLKPELGVVCVAHPIKEGNRVICSMYDPLPGTNGEMQVNKGELLYVYYWPIYQLIREKGMGEAYCRFSLDENKADEIKCHIEMPKKVFDLFTEYPDFSQWNKKERYSQIKETMSGLYEYGKDDLLRIELIESERT